MDLRINKFSYHSAFPLPLRSTENTGKNIPFVNTLEEKKTRSENTTVKQSEINLPILATANDLREAVRFLKNKPNGVSVVEIMNAEPRRVFDARKIAAYEFWGIIKRDQERLQLTALGEELAKNTEAECEINRRILRSISAYLSAIEWIYRQKIKIATFYDVADFWRQSTSKISLSDDSESNIESVMVSFFSLCHTAELGTATVGKRGQPARLSVNLEQIHLFLKSSVEIGNNYRTSLTTPQKIYSLDTLQNENTDCVYISSENQSEAVENLSAALELADFFNLTYIVKPLSHELLPPSQLVAMKQCQDAIFLLDEKDCINQKGTLVLRCERITELSVAQALFGERIIVLWQSREMPPDSLRQSGINIFVSENLDWEMNVKLVKHLKNLKN